MEDQKREIQLFTPTFEVDECLAEIRECLEKGWTGLGYKPYSLKRPGRLIPAWNTLTI